MGFLLRRECCICIAGKEILRTPQEWIWNSIPPLMHACVCMWGKEEKCKCALCAESQVNFSLIYMVMHFASLSQQIGIAISIYVLLPTPFRILSEPHKIAVNCVILQVSSSFNGDCGFSSELFK
jgi:hypothetical protein